ncbi:hypothetical protein SNE40_014841 [Patella caerulea]|uniref:GPI transamidase component PIG-S n=1 Tax=Patella caerulea TaxID=87958 RepID=A0AAN8JJG7_PATCE
MTDEDISEKEKDTQAYAALGIGLICIVVGLPLWWKATEVYRVQLPYSDINGLSEIPLTYTAEVQVVCFDDVWTKRILEISQLLQDNLSKTTGTEIKANYRLSVRERTTEELDIFKQKGSVPDLPFVDDELSKSKLVSGDRNKYYIFLVPKLFKLDYAYIGKHHNILIRPLNDVTELVKDISGIVKSYVIHEDSVEKSILNAKGARSLKPDKESMRSVRYNPGYDITFTLTVPQPDILDVRWQIEEAVTAYIESMTNKLTEYTSFEIKSQLQYFTTFQSKPKYDESLKEYYYQEQNLPQLINPIESTLGTSSSNNPELNFIVYIPTRDKSPLYIRDKNGNKVKSNAFLSPRWGGVMIYNVPEFNSSAALPYLVQVDMRQVMEVFVSQIRLLLNVNSAAQLGSKNVVFEPVGVAGINDIEIDVWLRNRCAENLATSINTLQSLAQLLGQISNIVIKDDIGSEVETAVESIKNSQKLLQAGNLVGAFQASKLAIIASEKAFFDPSLLELLYFPEDQKFAIYIPLFLPISIPVIGSIYKAIKHLRGSNKAKKD